MLIEVMAFDDADIEGDLSPMLFNTDTITCVVLHSNKTASLFVKDDSEPFLITEDSYNNIKERFIVRYEVPTSTTNPFGTKIW